MLTKDNPTIHRYKWTLEEIIIISVLTVTAPIAALLTLVLQGSVNLVLTGVLAVVTLPLVGLLVRLGKKRKNNSQLFAYVENNIMFVTGFGLDESNAAPIKSIHSVSTKKHGIADSLVFRTRGAAGRTLVVPQRLAEVDGVREVVLAMFDNAPEKSKSAITLAERIKNA